MAFRLILNMLNLLVMIAFLVRSKNILFGQICSKNSKLSVSDETWWVDQVEYAELNSDTHFFLFWAENNFFGQICFKNIKIFYLRWKLVRNPFEYAEFGGYVHLSCFGLMIPILAKFGPKKENYLFQMKFGKWANWKMLNSMVMFICPTLDW